MKQFIVTDLFVKNSALDNEKRSKLNKKFRDGFQKLSLFAILYNINLPQRETFQNFSATRLNKN